MARTITATVKSYIEKIAIASLFILTTGCTFLVTSCSDPYKCKVPVNVTSMEKDVLFQKALTKLPENDRNLIIKYLIGSALASAFGVQDTIGGIKTIGVILREARKEAHKDSVDAFKKDSIDREAREKEAANQKRINDILNVTVLDFKFVVTETMFMNIEKFVYKISFTNNSDKVISAMKGELAIYDVFNEKLCSFDVLDDKSIQPHETYAATYTKYYNYMYNGQSDLKERDSNKLKFKWEPSEIVFENGEKIASMFVKDAIPQ